MIPKAGTLLAAGALSALSLARADLGGLGGLVPSTSCSLPEQLPEGSISCAYLGECVDCPKKCVPVMGGTEQLGMELVEQMLPNFYCTMIAAIVYISNPASAPQDDSLPCPTPEVVAALDLPPEVIYTLTDQLPVGHEAPFDDWQGAVQFFTDTCVDEVLETPDGAMTTCSAGTWGAAMQVAETCNSTATDVCTYGFDGFTTEACATSMLTYLEMDPSGAPTLVETWKSIYAACQAQTDEASCMSYDGTAILADLTDIFDGTAPGPSDGSTESGASPAPMMDSPSFLQDPAFRNQDGFVPRKAEEQVDVL